MEKGQKKDRPRYYQVVLEGSPAVCKGFLQGLSLAAPWDNTIIYHGTAKIFTESLGEQLAEFIHFHSRDLYAIADSKTASFLKKSRVTIEVETGILLASCRYIRSAAFPFDFRAYAKRYGKEILDILSALPKGVRVHSLKKKEVLHPDAVGIESYTSVHDYKIEGEGIIKGRIDLVIKSHSLLNDHPLINTDHIKLKLA